MRHLEPSTLQPMRPSTLTVKIASDFTAAQVSPLDWTDAATLLPIVLDESLMLIPTNGTTPRASVGSSLVTLAPGLWRVVYYGSAGKGAANYHVAITNGDGSTVHAVSTQLHNNPSTRESNWELTALVSIPPDAAAVDTQIALRIDQLTAITFYARGGQVGHITKMANPYEY